VTEKAVITSSYVLNRGGVGGERHRPILEKGFDKGQFSPSKNRQIKNFPSSSGERRWERCLFSLSLENPLSHREKGCFPPRCEKGKEHSLLRE